MRCASELGRPEACGRCGEPIEHDDGYVHIQAPDRSLFVCEPCAADLEAMNDDDYTEELYSENPGLIWSPVLADMIAGDKGRTPMNDQYDDLYDALTALTYRLFPPGQPEPTDADDLRLYRQAHAAIYGAYGDPREAREVERHDKADDDNQ